MTGTTTPSLKTSQTIALTVPIETFDDEKKRQVTAMLVMNRPKTRHVKQLAILLGAEFVQSIFGDSDGDGEVTREAIVGALGALFDPARLDGVTGIVADLCGVEPAIIDEVDPVDLPELVQAILGFFPELPSIGSSSL